MKICLLFALCCVLYWRKEVQAEIDNEVKRGIFPFMAILYYPDDTVVDSMGVRFQRAAVLVKPQWLISAAIDHSTLDGIPLGFPRKTLLARAGAVSLDANFTLNEDEDEQEREVIQIVRPSIHNKEMWWFTDITLLQTLLPFNMTSSVAVTTISPKSSYTDKNCIFLVYAKRFANGTEDKILMQLGVELMPSSVDNCGTQFSDTTMVCAVDSDETKNSIFDADFCQGNSGGPLMCEGEVMALQTYIENNCKQLPRLYQLLVSWDSFINCGIEEKCNADGECKICVAVHKDNPSSVDTTVLTTSFSTVTEPITMGPTTTETEEVESSTIPPTTIQDTQSPVTETIAPETSTYPTTTLKGETEQTVTETTLEPTETATTSTTTTTSTTSSTTTKSWPREKPVEDRKQLERANEVPRKTNVEAQIQPEKPTRVQSRRSSSKSTTSYTRHVMANLFISLLILECVF